MSEHKLHIEQGDFINKEKLFDYLRNKLSDTEKLRIEKLIAQDPFLQDAVEGLKGADLNTIEITLAEIFAKVDSATAVQKTNTFSANIRKYAAAASIILFLGMSWVIIDNLNKKQNDASEIAVEPTIIKADKNRKSIIPDDSSDMGGGSAANDSITMDELKDESISYNISERSLKANQTVAESNYDFDYTDDVKSEKSITTEMIITPPIMVDQNVTLSSELAKDEQISEFNEVVTAGAVSTETVSKSEEKMAEELDEVYLKKEKKLKSKTSKSENAGYDAEINAAPASLDTLAPVFTFVEQMPAFPGGTDSLNMFILHNLNTDCGSDKDCRQGNVFVKFIVNEDGTLSDAQIIKTFNPQFDQEVLRVISLMPKWIPGEQNSVKVKVWYTLKVKIDYN